MRKFSLYGESIEFTDAECNTIMLREEYIKKATRARQDLLSYLDQLDPAQENFLECLQNFGRDTIIYYLTPVIEYAQTAAINSEAFDKDFIMDLYIERIKSEWFDLLDGLADEYDRIWYDAESMRQYRELRKMSRGRWVGGGFGIKGALMGAAQAGILNAASAGIHSAVNAMGNANSNRKARNELRKIFKNVKDDLVKGLWCCIFDIQIVKMYVLDKCENKQFANYSTERFKTAELVVKQFENASKQIIDDQKELEFSQTALKN